MIPVICFELLYPDMSLEEKIKRIADFGFNKIEFWSWKDKDIQKIKEACDHTNVKVVNFSGQRSGDLIDQSTHSLIEEDLKSALITSNILDVNILMILCQELGDNGVVINPHHKMGLYDKIKNSIAGLKKLLKILPDDKILVLELLNTVLDHKGYFLNDVHLAVKIIDEVDDSRLKILFDFYHLGLMGYDPIKIIDKYSSYFGYVHIADYPGRHEPGSSRADWPLILKHLDNSGYKGYVGFEFSPESDTDQALRKIKGIWNSL